MTVLVSGGVGVAGLADTDLGGPVPKDLTVFALPTKPVSAGPYLVHVYDHSMHFKRMLGGGTLGSSILGRPVLKSTQNGGYQSVVLELAAAQPSSNLIPDPGFEIGLTFGGPTQTWVPQTPAWWQVVFNSPLEIRSGQRAAVFTTTVTTTNTWDSLTTLARFPIKPGLTYTASAWWRQNAGVKQSHYKINLYDASGSWLSSAFPYSGQVDGLKAWTRYTGTFVAPAYAVSAEVQLMGGWWDGVNGTNATTWFDDIRVVQGLETIDPIELGDVIRLTESSDQSGEIVFSGNVETVPEELAPGATHHLVEVTPWIAELGDGFFNQTYATATDVAQFVRDAVAETDHCSVTPISCPDTGVTAIYDFQNTNPLDAIHVAKQVAGSAYWYFCDAEGVVWFQHSLTSIPATVTLRRGADFTAKKQASTIAGLRNKIVVIGGPNPGDPSRMQSLYDNQISQQKYGIRSFQSTLSYPNINWQPTLDLIAASIGAQFDRVQTTVEVYCPAFGKRFKIGRPGGVTVRLWEPASEPLEESGETGDIGGYSSTFILQDVEEDGVGQRLVIGDIPYTEVDTSYEAARVAQRLSVIGGLVSPIPTLDPPPSPPQTLQYGKVKPSAGIKTMGGGIVTIATATFITDRDGTCQLVGSVDARMEAWDNNVPTPRRAVRATLSGGLYTGTWQELPFGLNRNTYDLSSNSGIAIPAGTYTVQMQIDTQEYNQIHIYSGYVQVVWTG